MTTHITLHRSLDPASPDWLHLVPSGNFTGTDGRGGVMDNADAVIAASMQAGKLAIDENHSTDLAAKRGHSAPARGWIVEMQSRPDGLWGRVDWTPSGKALMADQAYRGISPVLVQDAATGQVLRIKRAALTNDPNLSLTTLHSQEPAMSLAKAIITTLGLKADADEATIGEAVKALHAAKAEVEAAHSTALKSIAEAAGVKGGKAVVEAADIITTLQAAKAATGDVPKLEQTITTLQSQVNLLDTELKATRATTAKDKATAFVDAAIAAGKPVKPLRDHYITRHAADPATVEKEIGAMVSLHSGGIIDPGHGHGQAAGGDTALELKAKAELHQAKQKEKGIDVSYSEAVLHVARP